MRRLSSFRRFLLFLLAVSLGLSASPAGAEPPVKEWDRNWGHWRGPLVTGVAPHGDPPVEWSETRNVRWKIDVPGTGLSTPVIWGDRLFITTAVPTDREVEAEKIAAYAAELPEWMLEAGILPKYYVRFVVMAIDRHDGSTIWEKTVRVDAPHEGTHIDGSWAAASAVTDGEVLIAHFGSNGTYAMNLDGEPLWEVDLGNMTTRRGFGDGSTPAIHGDTVVINWDHEADSFLVALNRDDGSERWRTARDNVTSWSTPLIVDVKGKPQVIVAATGESRGYDLATGEVVWSLGGMTVNSIPTPMEHDGLVYLMSGYRGTMLQAVRLKQARGQLDNESKAVAWSYEQDTPYVPSGLLYDGRVWFLKHFKGILSVLDARSGKPVFVRQRLDELSGVYASIVGAADRVYIVGRAGTAYVLRNGDSFEVLAKNKLDDHFDASPAVVGRDLYLRGRKHLYCISEAEGR